MTHTRNIARPVATLSELMNGYRSEFDRTDLETLAAALAEAHAKLQHMIQTGDLDATYSTASRAGDYAHKIARVARNMIDRA